ncbi:MAG: hypothetical protein SPI77_02995 [Corynebacterium sp.]|nr:hypothetical protein [Corynebacterium sp.]
MNFDAIMEQASNFSSEGLGAQLKALFEVIFSFLYPANADPASPVEILPPAPSVREPAPAEVLPGA